MKKLLAVLMGVLFLAVSALPSMTAAGTVEKAHELKASGDLEGAADEHPSELCKGVYLVKAAWKLVGRVDTNGDNQIKSGLTQVEKAAGLALLDKADKHFTAAEGDKSGCTGAKLSDWKAFSANTRACIEGHCNK